MTTNQWNGEEERKGLARDGTFDNRTQTQLTFTNVEIIYSNMPYAICVNMSGCSGRSRPTGLRNICLTHTRVSVVFRLYKCKCKDLWACVCVCVAIVHHIYDINGLRATTGIRLDEKCCVGWRKKRNRVRKRVWRKRYNNNDNNVPL